MAKVAGKIGMIHQRWRYENSSGILAFISDLDGYRVWDKGRILRKKPPSSCKEAYG